MQEEPTDLKINSGYRKISTLPEKLFKSDINQETNGQDCWPDVNQYIISIAQA